MKFICLFFFSILSSFLSAQTTYEIIKDSTGTMIYKGLVPVTALEKESSFTWMKQDLSRYQPDSNCISLLNQQKDSIYLIVFAGTWCSDTQTILPQLFQLLKKSNFPLTQVNLMGVDRKKKTSGTLSESMGIQFVPTILVMKKGKERGRVVEYGKYGQYDKELAEILSQCLSN